MKATTLTRETKVANTFTSDVPLQKLLTKHLTKQALEWATPRLARTGELASGILNELADAANKNTPTVKARNRYGEQIDELVFHPSYQRLREYSYGEGIVGSYYDAKVRQTLGESVETVKFTQGYLFSQAEQGLYCPICLTDGTAYMIERFGSDSQKSRFLPHLTSTTMENHWEGAMFLTEKEGGSDVGAIEMRAVARKDGTFELYGEKWFCSNAGAELAMVLARPEGAPSGTKGLGLFAVRRHREDGKLNGIGIARLKDKLGTRSMPTAEMVFEGAIAEPVGDLSRGFLQMAEMLNLSRLYNATASVGVMRKALTEAISWTKERHTFGQPLFKYPMVGQTLVELAVEHEANLQFLFKATSLRGRSVANSSLEDYRFLRIMIPLVKMITAKLCVWSASEALELHGGNGYVEDWYLARLLRDAQVLPIWEGASNILALDVMRAIKKEQSHDLLFSFIRESASDPRIAAALAKLEQQLKPCLEDTPYAGVLARQWCFFAARLLQAALLCSAADDPRSQAVADSFIQRHLSGRSVEDNTEYQRHCVDKFDTILGWAL